jgi:hypothetical protein
MGYWIYGRDAKSDEPARRLFSEAETEDAARAEGESRGMLVEAVRPALTADAAPGAELRVPAPGGPYEFTEAQNATIASLVRYMRLAGIALLLFGLLQVAGGILSRNGWSLLVQAAVSLVLGALLMTIATRFRRIVDSRGRDIGHLMEALTGLRLMYALQVWTVAAGIALIALVLALAVLKR